MQTPFHASGFIYHPASGQILLQEFHSGDDVMLSLFGSASNNSADPQTVFQQCVEKALGMKVSPTSIHPVYDYVHDNLGEHYIFYVEVSEAKPVMAGTKNKAAWCPLSKLAKLNMSEQTRHDIVVGERVLRNLLESTQPPRTAHNH